MTHPTLTRAAIAITAIVLGVRADAQDGAADDPVRSERARIEAAVTGAQQEELDRQLVQFIANALILGNEGSVRDLGVAGVPALKSLALEHEIADLATYHENPIESIARVAPLEAVLTLQQALALSTRRFSALCVIEDGLAEVAAICRRRARDQEALVAVVERALGNAGFSSVERETIALACLKGGVRSQAIDDAAIQAPRLLESSAGARLFVERERRLHPEATAWTAGALLDIDPDAFFACTSNPEFHGVILEHSPWTPALRPRTVAALLRLSTSSDATDYTRRQAREMLAGRSEQLRAEDLRLALPERRSALVEVIDSFEPSSGYHYYLVEATLRCAEVEGPGVLEETARALLDGAAPERLSNVSGWARGADRPVESILAIWKAMASSGERSLDYVTGALVEQLKNRTSEEQARVAQSALGIAPDLEEAWKPLLRFAPPAGLPADLAVRSVRVLTAKSDAWVRDLFDAAPAWQGVGEGLRDITADTSEELRTRLVAAAVLLRTGEARPEDAARVRDLLLVVEAGVPPYDALAQFASSDATFPRAAAIEARNRAVIDAWNARLDAGQALQFGALSRGITGASDAVKADALALVRRVLGGPHTDRFLTTNGGAVIRLVDSAAPGAGDGFELVAAAVAHEKGSSPHFDLALERGFERAALEGGLRRAESGFLYSGNSNGERYSKPFLSRLVGLPAFRADAANALRLSEALTARGDVELMGYAKEALEEIAALKEVAARIANPTDAVAADAAPDLRGTLFEWIAAGRADGADETAYKVGAIALQTLADLGDPRDRDYFRGLIESPIYGMDSERAASMFRAYLTAWSKR